jgi:hypothetical protein
MRRASPGNGCAGTPSITAISKPFAPDRTSQGGARSSAGAGGYDFPVDPALDELQAPVFWLARDDPSVVVLTTPPLEIFDIRDAPKLPPTIQEMADEDGVHRILRLGAGDAIQILAMTPAPMAALVPLDRQGFERLEAVRRLLAGIHGRTIPPDTRMTAQQKARATRMLRAFDGARAGATQQEIASVLLRLDPLDRDAWQDSSARHTVKSLLRDARAMVSGGYLRLLRHFPRD